MSAAYTFPFAFAPFSPRAMSAAHPFWQAEALAETIDNELVDEVETAQSVIWNHAERAFENHMAFVEKRLKEDLDCAEDLGQCSKPEEAISRLEMFFTKMIADYSEHAMDQMKEFGPDALEELAPPVKTGK